MRTVEIIQAAIKDVNNGMRTQYINVDGKTIRVADHGANPTRTDENTISLVVGNDEQSYRSDRGRVVTNWERSNQFYVDCDGCFSENFDSIESFINYFDINN